MNNCLSEQNSVGNKPGGEFQITLMALLLSFVFLVFLNGCAKKDGKVSDSPPPSRGEPARNKDNSGEQGSDEEEYYETSPSNYKFPDGRNITIPALKIKKMRAASEALEWKCFSDAAANFLSTKTPDKPLLRGVDQKLLDLMNLKEGMYVADVGCGEGTYVFALADLVGPSGRVYATDLEPNSAEFIKWKIKVAASGYFEAAGYEKTGKGDYSNIHCRANIHDDVQLPEKKFDWLFLNQVHYCTARNGDIEVMRKFTDSLKKVLKPGGKILMTEWIMADKEDVQNHRVNGNFMTMDEIVTRLESFGMKVLKREDSYDKHSAKVDWKGRTILIIEPQ